MDKKLIDIVVKKADEHKLSAAMLLSFVEVESGGNGFDPKTGKILIQFEPAWFKKKAPYAPSGLWSVNKVDVQTKEWLAFNDAYSKNPTAALESTSIGLPQIMGFNFKVLGFKTVNEMWDFMKASIENQIECLIRFIKSYNAKLFNAFVTRNYHLMAYYYNGSAYAVMAKKWKREPYNISLEKAYNKFVKLGYSK